MISYPSGNTWRGQHIFPECLSEHAFGGWLPTKGELHKLLQKGEYGLLGDAPIFEGTFVQVTKKGEFIGILNRPNIVILGILASTPAMLLPDLMIIARDKKEEGSKTRKLEIARLIPLELVEIYVHDMKERRLKIHMMTGRNYYLQLCAPDGEEGFLFERWMRLIYLLHVASGKTKPPSKVTSKDIGLHTIWKTSSMPSETQNWLPAIMGKESSEELKKWASRVSASRTEQKSKPSAAASKQSPSKSGASKPTSQQRSGTGQTKAYPSGHQPPGSVSKDLSKLKSKTESQHRKYHRHRRFSTCRPCPFSPPPSFHSVAVGNSETDIASVGVGPSAPFTLSEAVGPSQPASQLSPWGSSQRKSLELPVASGLQEHLVVPKESSTTQIESMDSGQFPVKLERSKKSRSLVEDLTSQVSEQNKASRLMEKSATEAQVSSRRSSRSTRPPNEGEGGNLTSQSSSRKQSQKASRTASTRAPSASPAARSRMSAAVGSSDAYTKTVAAGPSEVGAVSVAAGPSQPASRASQAASAKSKASLTLASPGMKEEAEGDVRSRPVSREMSVKSKPSEKPGTSAAPSRLQSPGRTSAPYSQMAGMNEEPEGDVRSRPISREMSVKSKPSEKQGTSAAPSRLQSLGRTSAPYSQMAGMNEDPEGDVRSRPVSREMSVKSKPSEKQGTSAAPSRLQSPGRTSAPYSQMAGMNEDPEGDVRSRPISREMSVKSKPSEKQGTSAAPSRLESLGRTSAPYSQMAGMNEEPEGDRGSRPISREMSVKSKPSEKQGTSAAPSRLQSPGRTSAPYSQMAGMNEEPEGDRGSRPISREMSVKSKPSEKQGTSAAPSRLQSPGRTSAPYSQMAGMNEEPEGDRGSRPISREMSVKSKPSEKQGTSAAPSRLHSPGRTSRPHSQMGGMESQKLSKTKSSKPGISSGPSQERGHYTSPVGRTKKGWSQFSRKYVSVAAGPSEPGLKSVAVGTSQPFKGDKRRHRSRTPDASKSGKLRKIFSRKKSKSRDKSKPSSATEKKKPPRDQPSKSTRLPKDAKQRSSLTFVTIYSVLSSSMERLRGSKSKEDAGKQSPNEEDTYLTSGNWRGSQNKASENDPSGQSAPVQEENLENVTPKPSKRVTISGVIGPSGKSAPIEEPFFSESDTVMADEAFSTTATLGSEPGDLSTPPSNMEASQLTVGTSNVESSAAPSKLDRPASDQIPLSPGPSEKSVPSKEASVNAAALPPQSKTSVARGASAAAAEPTLAGSSTSANPREKEQPSAQSQQQSNTEGGWTPGPQPSSSARPPERSRVSVGAGSAIVETKSEAVGPSVRGSLRDAAAGPSTAGNWKQQGEASRIQSRQQSKREDGWTPGPQPFASARPPERSRMSVGVGRSAVETKSEAVGPSTRSSLRDAAAGPSTAGNSRIQSRQQSKTGDGQRPRSLPSAPQTGLPDRSRVSVGVGRSAVETKSAAIGPSGSWTEHSECKLHSRQWSQADDSWRMSSRPSSLPGPPDRPYRSVGVGRSVVETKSVGVGRSQRETVSEGAGPSKPGSKSLARSAREPDGRLREHNVFEPQGWLGTVEAEDAPRTAATTPRPSNRTSRVTTPLGGYGSRVTKDASSRSYN